MRTVYAYTILPLLVLAYALSGHQGVQLTKFALIGAALFAIAAVVQLLAGALLPIAALAIGCYLLNQRCTA